jgi:hypothetical protein
MSEWLLINTKMSKCIMARTSYIQWDDVRLVLDQHA